MRNRSNRSASIEIELLPFLSVLACTIGTLILLILVLTSQLYSEQQEVKILVKTENGKNLSKFPRYIECQEDGVIIHPSQTFVSQTELNRNGSAFKNLLNQMSRNREREYLIVAVRPNGIKVFQEVRELIEKEKIDIGYEPINNDWKLKLEG